MDHIGLQQQYHSRVVCTYTVIIQIQQIQRGTYVIVIAKQTGTTELNSVLLPLSTAPILQLARLGIKNLHTRP